jgi:hypothetical protein
MFYVSWTLNFALTIRKSRKLFLGIIKNLPNVFNCIMVCFMCFLEEILLDIYYKI